MIESIIAGLIVGSGYAIIGVSLVLLNRFTGVLNFSQGAIGAMGAFTGYALIAMGAPIFIATLVGIVIAGLLGFFVGWVLTHFFADSTTTVRAVITITVLIALLTLGFRLFGDSPMLMPDVIPKTFFDVGSVRVSTTTVVAIGLTAVISVCISLFLKHSTLGSKYIAMSESHIAAQLLGINTLLLSLSAWLFLGMLSAIAGFLVAPTYNPSFASLSLLVVPALAAGVLGAFKNIWVVTTGGLLIGAVEGAGARINWLSEYRGMIPFIIILITLIWIRRKQVWDAVR
ncbi:MAG TPA: branched-chain amino acid ABC transporter permease [Microbacteriaceae bacterium]|nr:branched-chain amino acid ABC transporter permease [Microbacteriaceae bacterium]